MVYLDANMVIYFVEQPPVWGPKAVARIAALLQTDRVVATSDLARLECQVKPLRLRDSALLASFTSFFASADVQVLARTAGVCNRAASIRADHNFKPLDSLHLAAAVEHGCTGYLTNDAQLARFPDIPVGVLT